MNNANVFVAYLSPAGTTRLVAQTLVEAAGADGREPVLLDLAQAEKPELSPGDVLFVGSPVYAQHALPAVLDFIAKLPESPGAFAAPFATYGTVSSGVALHEMAEALEKKGMTLLGGIKVPTLHSMLFTSESPLGAGRPDSEDLARVREFAGAVRQKMEAPEPEGLALSDFAIYSDKVKEAAPKSGIATLKGMFPPMELNQEACTQCGICADNCLMRNIELSPYPVLADRCILCLNCVRLCPEQAMANPIMALIEPEIKKRADFFQEPPEVRTVL